MAYPIDAGAARQILAAALPQAECAYETGTAPSVLEEIADSTERLFTSATQAYREALVGCVVARCVNERINIRHPATDTSDDAFSGRSLADQVITPFLQEHAIPVSKSPYLSSLRGGARFEPGGAPRIQRDAKGFDALVFIVDFLAEADQFEARNYLVFLLLRFVVLREESRIELRRIAKPNLQQLTHLINGLLSVRSGGRLPALLATAMVQTISECHDLGWDVEFQGINVADAASGAVGDVTVRKHGAIVLGIEVTEREIDRSRIVSTFETKISPNGISDYIFVTTVPPNKLALSAAYSFTSVGHEMNIVQIRDWLTNNLATIGPRCRAIFQARMLCLLIGQNADLKVAWNTHMDAAIGFKPG